MLAFAKTHLSFYLLAFILCIAGFVISAPMSASRSYHRHRQAIDPPFPYGKLADKTLNVNHVSYMIDDREEDWILAYPDDDSYWSTTFSPDAIPPVKLELPVPLPNTIPPTSLFFFVCRILLPHIIKQVLAQERDIALSLVRAMQRSKDLLEEYIILVVRFIFLFSLSA